MFNRSLRSRRHFISGFYEPSWRASLQRNPQSYQWHSAFSEGKILSRQTEVSFPKDVCPLWEMRGLETKARWLFTKLFHREVSPWWIHCALEMQTLSSSWNQVEAWMLTCTNRIKIKVHQEMESFFGFNGSYFDMIKGILIFPAGVPPLSGGGKIITPIV